jgi:hypothetical protein
MKNIHILPTEKPSTLSILNNGKLNFGAEFISSSNSKAQHIYITSDEEIKEGDWVIHNGKLYKVSKNKGLYLSVYELSSLDIRTDLCKKIILTTDQDLIKDGVQGIDDEFLEWFVKNPSCESVKIESLNIGNSKVGYVICKPQEEHKQETLGEDEIIDISDHDGIGNAVDNLNNEPPQETLEEAALNYSIYNEQINTAIQESVKFGAKWQAEIMYSEDEVRKLLETQRGNCYVGILTKTKDKELAEIANNAPEPSGYNGWVKQFKKK